MEGKMAKSAKSGRKSPRRDELAALLGQALMDEKLRQQIMRSPDEVAKRFKLTKRDAASLRGIDPEELLAAAGKLNAKSQFAIMIVVRGHFDVK
jgi:hypothetical protein